MDQLITQNSKPPSYQLTNSLSRLATDLVAEKPNGHWGIGKDGEYDFIPSGGSKKVSTRPMTPDELQEFTPLFARPSHSKVKDLVVELSLRKRMSEASPATMPMLVNGIAADLVQFSELAILFAFREIRQGSMEFFPKSTIVQIVANWQVFVDDLANRSLPKEQITKAKNPKEEPLPPRSEAEKAAVAELVKQAIKHCGGGA